ncbi:ATP-binding cassette domain-containing protein [Desulfosporosinus sp. Sb-LF]|uniref:ABC transporter ATP-binding protein n=1 Tax=Desulfosporosinus sp. Sb-LF TaxID=2560027 RepID=UPI00107F1922|nr:ATP-binding cassette domain-containing protein [Desulfosporosinus sp. Sb-LF]TGE33062.1 ATP-binding cassette domain-containing protein [Desulfosporosinus sp. Sb-LF]
MKPEKVLEVQNIHYSELFNGVNFDWHQGEIIALMGANGSGKSTLARLLAGLIEPKDGEIRLLVDGIACSWSSVKRWKEIGFIGQHPMRQTIGATVAEELGFGLLNLGQDIHRVSDRVRELASSIGLGGKEDQSPATLSGGERQRLVVAAILALHPTFLILDEALTMLDTRAQANILELLFQVRGETGQLWITHDPELAYQADRLLVIDKGRVVDLGRPSVAFDNCENLSLYALGIMPAMGIKGAKDAKEDLIAKRNKDVNVDSVDKTDKGISSGKGVKEVAVNRANKHQGQDRALIEWRQANYDSRLRLNHVVRAGEFIGIVGPSGSGKTTLLESVVGLILPTEGQLLVCGDPISKSTVHTLRRKVRFVLQEAGEYLIGRSVYHEVFYGDVKQDLKSKTEDRLSYLEEFGLNASLAEVAPERLSGGERQMVALASALRTIPEILLLDEPLLGLDATSRAGIQSMISSWDNITILYVTHDLREVLPNATRLWIVEKGNVVLDCPSQCWKEHQERFKVAGVRF